MGSGSPAAPPHARFELRGGGPVGERMQVNVTEKRRLGVGRELVWKGGGKQREKVALLFGVTGKGGIGEGREEVEHAVLLMERERRGEECPVVGHSHFLLFSI